MGNSVENILCPNCGGNGYVDDDYKEKILIKGCDDCDCYVAISYGPDNFNKSVKK